MGDPVQRINLGDVVSILDQSIEDVSTFKKNNTHDSLSLKGKTVKNGEADIEAPGISLDGKALRLKLEVVIQSSPQATARKVFITLRSCNPSAKCSAPVSSEQASKVNPLLIPKEFGSVKEIVYGDWNSDQVPDILVVLTKGAFLLQSESLKF